MFNFLHNFQPNPILLKINSLEIHWYGFLIAIGVFLALMLAVRLAKKYGLNEDRIYDLMFYVIIFGLIGDRLYYVFYAWDYYRLHLVDIFKIWQGGLAIHGAMIAGLIVVFIYCRKYKINSWLILDIIVVSLALAMSIGRWGNYFNMELFGRPTNLPWGIFISPEKRPAEFLDQNYFHPTFLYESIWDLLIFVVLIILHKFRLVKNKNPESNRGYGNIFLLYLFLYSAGRLANELLRIDYSPYVFGWRWAQLVSLGIMLLCLFIFGYKIIKRFKWKKSG